jgi:hypothetical protein
MGFIPKHIVDVGQITVPGQEKLTHFPDAYYTLLEPQNWLKNLFRIY